MLALEARIPLTPAKRTCVAVGAYHVGAEDALDINACPVVPAVAGAMM
jgi:hypothetical protein